MKQNETTNIAVDYGKLGLTMSYDVMECNDDASSCSLFDYL